MNLEQLERKINNIERQLRDFQYRIEILERK